MSRRGNAIVLLCGAVGLMLAVVVHVHAASAGMAAQQSVVFAANEDTPFVKHCKLMVQALTLEQQFGSVMIKRLTGLQDNWSPEVVRIHLPQFSSLSMQESKAFTVLERVTRRLRENQEGEDITLLMDGLWTRGSVLSRTRIVALKEYLRFARTDHPDDDAWARVLRVTQDEVEVYNTLLGSRSWKKRATPQETADLDERVQELQEAVRVLQLDSQIRTEP